MHSIVRAIAHKDGRGSSRVRHLLSLPQQIELSLSDNSFDIRSFAVSVIHGSAIEIVVGAAFLPSPGTSQL